MLVKETRSHQNAVVGSHDVDVYRMLQHGCMHVFDFWKIVGQVQGNRFASPRQGRALILWRICKLHELGQMGGWVHLIRVVKVKLSDDKIWAAHHIVISQYDERVAV
jgi:hypothetical protein